MYSDNNFVICTFSYFPDETVFSVDNLNLSLVKLEIIVIANITKGSDGNISSSCMVTGHQLQNKRFFL